MPLISRRIFPPNGWNWFQPETGWPKSQSEFAGLTFDQVVEKIAEHRQANPRHHLSTDLDDIANELDVYTCMRLKFNPQYCAGSGVPPKCPAPLSAQTAGQQNLSGASGAGVAVGTKVKRIVAGIGTLIDWLGNGGEVVPQAQAETRAAVCAACPLNQPGGWEEYFTTAAAAQIKNQLEMKQDMRLATPVDDKLRVCAACSCVLALKVWVPFQYVKKKLSQKQQADLHPDCWILKELKHQ